METTVEAFEAVFRANYDDLLRFASRRVGPDSAADVVADVFLVAWRRRAELPTDAARLWLFGVAANIVANERRSELRRERLARRAAAEPAPDSTDPMARVDIGAEVRQALAKLPHHEQEALRLTEWEQLDPVSAARVAGCSSATFRVRLHRARRRLAAGLAAAESATILRTEQDVIA